MSKEIESYKAKLTDADNEICTILDKIINVELQDADSKIWHGHPVWFLAENPIVGYSKEKAGIRLMFWSGADFNEDNLNVKGKKFKDASIFYNDISEVVIEDVERWLRKSRTTQWDYKNIVKRKGRLEKLFLTGDLSKG